MSCTYRQTCDRSVSVGSVFQMATGLKMTIRHGYYCASFTWCLICREASPTAFPKHVKGAPFSLMLGAFPLCENLFMPSLRRHNHEVICVTLLFYLRKFVTQMQNNTQYITQQFTIWSVKWWANWSLCSVIKWTIYTDFNLMIRSCCRGPSIHSHWHST